MNNATSESAIASPFESAVEAIISGDAPTLEKLLHDHPELIRERSTRPHHATLLHYVGANGVEDYRQKTPKNAVQIAKILLQSGADVEAMADIYGGSATLGLVATSVHPFLAGVQNDLIDVLLEHGAAFDGTVDQNYKPGRLVTACLANGRGKAAEHLAHRGAPLNLEGAAGLGMLELVKTFFDHNGALQPNTTRKEAEFGFTWACEYGRTSVVDCLLQMGIDVHSVPHGETGLHWAAYNGDVGLLSLLLNRKASVSTIDQRFHGTPLDWALYGWSNPPLGAPSGDYYGVVRHLVAAGAKANSSWLTNCHGGSTLLQKIQADPNMVAALGKELPSS
ncbi:MAG: ankyrin repeat protein [Verrucomicrobiales bacterium]|nr:ankyrin repeat protein [Verrucomicrobiales bacterium]